LPEIVLVDSLLEFEQLIFLPVSLQASCTSSSLALMRRPRNRASFRVSRSPARIDRIMACPDTPLISLMALASGTFIDVNDFCMC
jgi:hypothetical protein